MPCRGIITFGLELPYCFTENNEVMRREVTACGLLPENCPKRIDKNKITKRCFTEKYVVPGDKQ